MTVLFFTVTEAVVVVGFAAALFRKRTILRPVTVRVDQR